MREARVDSWITRLVPETDLDRAVLRRLIEQTLGQYPTFPVGGTAGGFDVTVSIPTDAQWDEAGRLAGYVGDYGEKFVIGKMLSNSRLPEDPLNIWLSVVLLGDSVEVYWELAPSEITMNRRQANLWGYRPVLVLDQDRRNDPNPK